jgi:hypothetical protein
VNAQTVQHAAEERLRNGLATLPDVLEAARPPRRNTICKRYWEQRKSRGAIWQLPWGRRPPRAFVCNH